MAISPILWKSLPRCAGVLQTVAVYIASLQLVLRQDVSVRKRKTRKPRHLHANICFFKNFAHTERGYATVCGLSVYLYNIQVPWSHRWNIWPRLLWRTNRKSHTRFRLVPKSMTMDDLERPKRHFCGDKKIMEPTRKKLNEDRLILSAGKCRPMILYSV